jgi:hypothetical protein
VIRDAARQPSVPTVRREGATDDQAMGTD